jgi:type I restriction enzyme S subunit
MKAQQLRNAVLQLAIQSKLLPQDPMDEPAIDLLERIKEEKEYLIKVKKIKREKPHPEITDEEKPFDIPDSWEWVRLGDVVQINPRNRVADDLDVSFIPMPLIFDGYRNLHTSDKRKWKEVKSGFTHFQENDVAIAKITPCFENRKSVVFCNLFNGIGAGTTELHILRPYANTIMQKYLLWLVKTQHFINSGTATYTGTAGQQRIGKEFVADYIFPLPPITEQQRIVTKIEEIMPLIDQYDKFETELSKLETDFPNNLKKSILQYAVQGKLVKQYKDDEPASVLLEKIKTKKEQLIKEKKIKSEKPFSEITDEEIPYELPNGWEWVRLGELCKVVDYGSSTKASTENIGVPILRMNNIIKGKVDFTNLKYVNVDIVDLPKLFLEDGDLIFNRTNSYELVGKTGLFTEQKEQYTFASYLIRCTLINCDPVYINYYMNSNIYRKTQIEPQIIQQNGQANFNGTKLKGTLVPIPPLAEQQRIVAKVDELMALCDVLSDENPLNNHMLVSEANKVIEFKPQLAQQDGEYAKEFDMVARAESISPETQAKMAERIKLLRTKK